MRKSNKKVIIIAVIVAIILIVLITGAILFFTTDFLKSDQQLFFKYLAQNIEVMEQYLEDPNKSAIDEIKNEQYIVNSDITFDLVSTDPQIANQTTPPRNFSIEYTKSSDPQYDRDYSEAKIRYLTRELFTAQYAHDGNLHVVNGINSINSIPIFNVYLGIENNNLKQLAQKMGIEDVSNIPNRIENVSLTELITFNSQEKDYIQNLLIKVINTQIPKNKYYHNKHVMIEIDTQQVETNCYGVTLTSNEYKTLLISILNEISQDDTFLNILLQKIILIDSQTDMTISSMRQLIQNKIEQINSEEFLDGITIQVFEANGKIVRTQIELNSEEYYIFDYERANNSIGTIISLNNTYEIADEEQEQTSNSSNTTVIEEGYQIIEGTTLGQTQEIIPEVTTYTIKNIEIAKQIKGDQSNIIVILTYEKNGETIKVSLQNLTQPSTEQEGYSNNIVIIVNKADTTYFTIKANSNITPTNNASVQEIDETNSAVLNNRTSENIKQIIDAIKVQLQIIYEQQMQVAQEVQQEEDLQNGLNSVDPNSIESNTITNIQNVVE